MLCYFHREFTDSLAPGGHFPLPYPSYEPLLLHAYYSYQKSLFLPLLLMQELIANRHYLIFIDCNNIYIILQTVKAIDLYTEVTKKHTSFTAQTTVGKQKAQASSFENVIALAHHSLMKV